MAELITQPITPDGSDLLTLLTAADAAGDFVKKSDGLLFVLTNGDAAPHTVTVASPVSETVANGFGKQAVSDISIAVPAGESVYFSVPSGYATSGSIQLTYDAVTSVSVGVFAVSPNA
jgi:hypothetical protein